MTGAKTCPLFVRGDGVHLMEVEQMSGGQEGFPTPLYHRVAEFYIH